MNIDEAKRILTAYRPGTADDADPHFAEALALARRDPELRAWLDAETASDAAIAARLKSVAPPPELLAHIQAGVRERLAGRPRRNHFPLALAASVMLLGLLAALLLFSRGESAAPGSFAAFRQDMTTQLRTMPSLDLNTDRITEVREWLATQSLSGAVEFPATLQKFPSIGCRTMDWNGHKAALVCFMVEGGEVLHVLVLPKTELPGALDQPTAFARVNGQNTASWTRGEHRFLAITRAEESVLRNVIL